MAILPQGNIYLQFYVIPPSHALENFNAMFMLVYSFFDNYGLN